MKDISEATGNTATQVRAITRANREHSQVAAALVDDLAAIRSVTDRSADGVRQTRTTTAELLKHAEGLTTLSRRGGTNGRSPRTNGH